MSSKVRIIGWEGGGIILYKLCVCEQMQAMQVLIFTSNKTVNDGILCEHIVYMCTGGDNDIHAPQYLVLSKHITIGNGIE